MTRSGGFRSCCGSRVALAPRTPHPAQRPDESWCSRSGCTDAARTAHIDAPSPRGQAAPIKQSRRQDNASKAVPRAQRTSLNQFPQPGTEVRDVGGQICRIVVQAAPPQIAGLRQEIAQDRKSTPRYPVIDVALARYPPKHLVGLVAADKIGTKQRLSHILPTAAVLLRVACLVHKPQIEGVITGTWLDVIRGRTLRRISPPSGVTVGDRWRPAEGTVPAALRQRESVVALVRGGANRTLKERHLLTLPLASDSPCPPRGMKTALGCSTAGLAATPGSDCARTSDDARPAFP